MELISAGFILAWVFFASVLLDIVKHPASTDLNLFWKIMVVLLLSMPFIAPYCIGKLEDRLIELDRGV